MVKEATNTPSKNSIFPIGEIKISDANLPETDNFIISQTFNKFFLDVGGTVRDNILYNNRNINADFQVDNNNRIGDVMQFSTISQEEVEEYLGKIRITAHLYQGISQIK